MSIVTLLEDFVIDLLKAEEDFIDNPVHMGIFEKRVVEASLKTAAGFMAMVLEDTDTLIRNSRARKDGYNIHRKDKRTLITTAGDVTYNRTLFKERSTGKYRYLLDDMMHLPKHERFSVNAEVKVLSEAEVHSYQHAADSLCIGGQTVSKTAVMEKIHAITEELPEEKPVPNDKKKCCEYLYIEADEDHIHSQKCDDDKKGIIGKLIYVFEGKEDICEGRRKLIGTHYHGGLYKGSEENKKLWEEVQEYIELHYNSEFLKKVYICSDGGGWIKAGADYVDKSVLIADKFHLMKYINKVSNLMIEKDNYGNSDKTKAEKVKAKIYKYIYKNNQPALKKLLGRIRNQKGHDTLIKDVRTYFVNNWDAIQRAFHCKNALGCSAEGHVSSVFSERMSSRPMGWSETGSDRMCRLRCYVRNNGREKIVDLVEYRRAKQYESLEATGTDGIIISMPKEHYSEGQREAMKYAEAMYAPLFGPTVKKILSIRERISDI